MNQVWLNGRLASDPEGGESGQGVSYATFAVALEKGVGERKQVIFLDCVAFRQPADFVKSHLHKGDSVNLIGSVNVRDFEDQSGIKRKKYEVIVSQVSFPVSGKSRSSGGGDRQSAPRNGRTPVGAGVSSSQGYDDEPY